MQPSEFLCNREYSGRVCSCATAAHKNNDMGATYLTREKIGLKIPGWVVTYPLSYYSRNWLNSRSTLLCYVNTHYELLRKITILCKDIAEEY